jgi:transmembrane sensor
MSDFSDLNIILKHLKGEPLLEGESDVLKRLLATEGGPEMFRQLSDKNWVRENLQRIEAIDTGPTWQKIVTKLKKEEDLRRSRRSIRLRQVAAVFLLLVASAACFYYWPRSSPANKNKATLFLGDRDSISLGAGGQSSIPSPWRNIQVSNIEGGLKYNAPDSLSTNGVNPGETPYNTLRTPRAGQYSLSLPDGTKVRLNNSSFLRYPVYFTDSVREVELGGEAYFDVMKDPNKPFRVVIHSAKVPADSTVVEVLGSKFNINAFSDEPFIKTILLEGRIKIIRSNNNLVLDPGQQAVADSTGRIQLLAKTDLQEDTSWWKGFFYFDKASLPDVMRQIARWYDVKVEYVYTGPFTQEYQGAIDRTLTLAQVLDALHRQNQEITFEIEGSDNHIVRVMRMHS